VWEGGLVYDRRLRVYHGAFWEGKGRVALSVLVWLDSVSQGLARQVVNCTMGDAVACTSGISCSDQTIL
jgi:ABC-type enterobactin transport system permease subunit